MRYLESCIFLIYEPNGYTFRTPSGVAEVDLQLSRAIGRFEQSLRSYGAVAADIIDEGEVHMAAIGCLLEYPIAGRPGTKFVQMYPTSSRDRARRALRAMEAYFDEMGGVTQFAAGFYESSLEKRTAILAENADRITRLLGEKDASYGDDKPRAIAPIHESRNASRPPKRARHDEEQPPQFDRDYFASEGSQRESRTSSFVFLISGAFVGWLARDWTRTFDDIEFVSAGIGAFLGGMLGVLVSTRRDAKGLDKPNRKFQ